MNSFATPLVPADDAAKKPLKPLTWFGYLPLRSECFPLTSTEAPDWPGVAANVGAGLVIGMREALGGIVSASLVFSTTGFDQVTDMFPFGIGMMWYSTSMGALWYAIFGRMQYVYGAAQDVIGILQAVMIGRAAAELTAAGEAEKIQATAVAIICFSSVLTGVSSVIIGKLGLGKFALLFPQPVTAGFLGAIGWVILRSSLSTASGVEFQYFYPKDLDAFCASSSLSQVGLQIATVMFIRLGPKVFKRFFPNNSSVLKVAVVACQLFPLVLFHVVAFAYGISMERLTEDKWVYPKEKTGGVLSHWTAYKLSDVSFPTVARSVVEMPSLVLMAVLCTTTGALAVSDRFPKGPEGDPEPMETLDFDRELTTVGVSSVLLGLTGGTLTFHTFAAIQLRLDGGTHRIASMAVALFVFTAFASGVPFGHYIPKWYLSGLFMNTAFHFLKGALFSFRNLPKVQWRGMPGVPGQYLITLSCILTSVFASPARSIFIGMILSIGLFLVQSSQASPVINVVKGNRVVSRTKRPVWEMRVLRNEGHRILLLYLQGQLFFGSARRLVALLSAALAGDEVQYCILSFARVPSVDPSAARHLKAMVERAKLSGCKVIICRTNHEVFGALLAAEVIESPDDDLVKYLKGLRWRLKPAPRTMEFIDIEDFKSTASGVVFDEERFSRSRRVLEPDAFTHETDALDWCDQRVVEEFCYRGPYVKRLEPYMLEYGRVCQHKVRLEETAFEQMNNLSPGTMNKLKGCCQVLENIRKWDRVPNSDEALCFVLRGSISLVQQLPHADQDMLIPQVQGFSFRQGKRLWRRYPPGQVVGKVEFFLAQSNKVMDTEFLPKVVVSSKFSDFAEVWVLPRSGWERLPTAIKTELTEMLCQMLAEDSQHAALQEH